MAETQQKKKSVKSGPELKNSTRPHAIIFDPAEKVTRGSFKDEVNINNVIKRFVRTGELPKARSDAQYGVAPSQTLHEAACINAQIASMEEAGELSHNADETESEAPEEPQTLSAGKTEEKALQEPEAQQASPEGAQ